MTAADGVDDASLAAVRDLAPAAPVLHADPSGAVRAVLTAGDAVTHARGSTSSSSAAASSASPRRTRWRAPAARSRSSSASRVSRPTRPATTPTSSTPGSTTRPAAHKARLAVAGCAETVAFCRDARPAVRGHRQAGRRDRTRRAAPPRRAQAARRRERRREPRAGRRPGCASTSRTCAGCGPCSCRRPGSPTTGRSPRRSASWCRRTAARSTSAGRSAASVRRRADVVVRTDGGDLLGTPGRGLRRPALRRAGAGVGRRPGRADHPVPRRVLRLRRARGGAGQGPDLPGARPGVPVPGRARHARGSTAACTPARTPCSRSPARATRGAW